MAMKRLIDFTAAALGLIVLALPLALLAWQVHRRPDARGPSGARAPGAESGICQILA